MRLGALLLLAALAAATLPGCERIPAGAGPDTSAPVHARPIDAVQGPARHLRANDLVALARDAVPPALHARLAAAWAADRSRWPLEELPLHGQLPRLIAALSAPDAERTLMAAFERQFTGAEGELRQAVETLGTFGVQYLRSDPRLDEAERDRETQRLVALSRWALQAPLTDPARARAALARLCAAARATGLDSEAALREAGMEDSLRRLSSFLAEAKAVLAGYGLDLDASLDAMTVELEQQTGDRARLRVRYALAGEPVDVRVEAERRDRRWYRSDWLRHAEAAAARPAPARSDGA